MVEKHFAGTKHLSESEKTSVRIDQSEHKQTREMRTPGWVKETKVPESDVALFPQKQTCLTTVYAARSIGFLCLNDKKRDDVKLLKKKKHSTVVCAFASQPQPVLCALPSMLSHVHKKKLSSTTICT